MIKVSQYWSRNFDEIWDSVKRDLFDFYFLKGGRGSGKSSFLSLMIVLGLVMDRRANAIVYRKVANTIGDSVFSQIEWAISRLGLDGWFRRKTSPYRFVHAGTGQEIVFRGCDDPLKSKSIKCRNGYFRYCWFEELSEFDGMDEIDSVVQSVARGSEGRTAILCSYNPPKSNQNWLNAEVLIPKRNRLVHHSTYLDLPAALIGEQFLNIAETTRLTNEKKYRHVYLGEVTGTGGEVFDNLEIRPITDDELRHVDYEYCGLDFGFAIDPAAIILCGFDRMRKELRIFREFYKTGAPMAEISEEIRRMGDPRVIADSAEPRSIYDLRMDGCRITGAKKGPGSVEHGMKSLQDLNKIIIDPVRCPNAAREFSSYEYEIDRYGNFKSAYPDRNNHAIDAVRYALEDVLRNYNFYTM